MDKTTRYKKLYFIQDNREIYFCGNCNNTTNRELLILCDSCLNYLCEDCIKTIKIDNLKFNFCINCKKGRK